MINIITINVALITLTLFDVPIFSFEAHPAKRYKELVDFLSESTADVVTLQEISHHWSKKLTKELREVYPYSTKYNTRKLISTEMLILSKYPLSDCSFEPFTLDTKLELTVLQKGMLSCVVQMPLREYTILSTHLVALGLSESPTSKYVEMVRSKQIEQLIQHSGKIVKEHPEQLLIVTGDFNAGPEASDVNYESLLEYFIDTFTWDESIHGKNKIQYTWLPGFDDNMAAKRIFKQSPAERIDMIFIPKSQQHLITVAPETEIVGDDFSDHAVVESIIITK